MSIQLIFFGSDKYSQIVLSHIRAHADFNITHITDLSQFDRRSLSEGGGTIGLAASFAHLFPHDLIAQFQGNLYNLHPSLLPQYRNVAPVPYAIALGDQETGITLQKIDAKIDHGEIIAQVKEPILSTDTTPTLLTRLFNKGAELFLSSLHPNFVPTGILENWDTGKLVFTHKLTRQTGYLEWDVVQKLLQGQTLKADDTQNELVKLRLTHHPDRTKNILPDLIRALTGYEKVWTVCPTKKGDLTISLPTPDHVLIPGKPRPIPLSDFTKYYLNA